MLLLDSLQSWLFLQAVCPQHRSVDDIPICSNLQKSGKSLAKTVKKHSLNFTVERGVDNLIGIYKNTKEEIKTLNVAMSN